MITENVKMSHIVKREGNECWNVGYGRSNSASRWSADRLKSSLHRCKQVSNNIRQYQSLCGQKFHTEVTKKCDDSRST